MSEFVPRISYSPEGILELRRTFPKPPEYTSTLFDPRELLDCMPGYEVTEDDIDTVVRVEVSRVLCTRAELDFNNPAAEHLIRNLARFTYFDYEDTREGIFSLDFWQHNGAEGVIYPHFQRWLNAGGLDEETGRQCINAMILPFGEEERHIAIKEFKYQTDGENAAVGMGGFTFGATSRKEDFGISVVVDKNESFETKRGHVTWNWIDLSTIGSCACWGASGEERQHVYISPETNRLYEMNPHNVDSAVQSVSLVLGAAALAHAAAQYEGQEDILEKARWLGNLR